MGKKLMDVQKSRWNEVILQNFRSLTFEGRIRVEGRGRR